LRFIKGNARKKQTAGGPRPEQFALIFEFSSQQTLYRLQAALDLKLLRV
jgi:hypothetical protein